VEADDRQAPAGSEHAIRLLETAGERFELVVHDDPQRLEDAPRGVAGGEPRRRRNRALDDGDELARRVERLLLACGDDAAGDLLRVALFAVATEDVGELVLAQSVDEVRGAERRLRVHAHVQGGVIGVREAPLPAVELHRRDAEVHVHHVHRGVAHARQHVGEVPVVETCLAGRRALEVAKVLRHLGVTVAGDQEAVSAETVGDGPRMPAGAEGAVDRDLPRLRPQEVEQLLHQHRRVGERHLPLTDSQARLR